MPTCKWADKNTTSFLPFSTQLYIVVDAINSPGHQHEMRVTPCDRDWKHLDLFGRKAYSSATLQFHIASYQALMTKYDYINYSKLNNFIEQLLESYCKAIVHEGQLVAKISLQSAHNSADTEARPIFTAVVM